MGLGRRKNLNFLMKIAIICALLFSLGDSFKFPITVERIGWSSRTRHPPSQHFQHVVIRLFNSQQPPPPPPQMQLPELSSLPPRKSNIIVLHVLLSGIVTAYFHLLFGNPAGKAFFSFFSIFTKWISDHATIIVNGIACSLCFISYFRLLYAIRSLGDKIDQTVDKIDQKFEILFDKIDETCANIQNRNNNHQIE